MSETVSHESRATDKGAAGVYNESLDRNDESDWAAVSDAMTESDEVLIGGWKDDLANLLVFSGLFSGVATGFVIESYGWLQPDTSPDVSVQLLAQISMQLASLSVSPGFINSTAPSLTVSQLSPPSDPAPSSVCINILWFLSLGLGLMASLLAIMVQQWLREYRVPGYMSTRDRIRLRQLRFQSLQDWGVPGIVALLPVLLQAALILFLAGLCYLLFTLDRTVAVAFVVFVGVALTAYFALVILPILCRRCPYRNPLSHALLAIFQVVTTAIWTVLMLTVFLGIWVTTVVSALLRKIRNTPAVVPRSARFLRYMVQTMTAGQKLHPIGGNSLWTDGDVKRLGSEKSVHILDRDALIWAPSGIAKSRTSSLDRCLQDLPHEERLECVVAWVAETLHVSVSAFDIGPGGARAAYGCIFDSSTICTKFDATFAARFKLCLLDVLPTRLASSDTEGLRFGYIVLMLLYKLARNGATSDVAYRAAFAHRLVDIMAAQTPEDTVDRWARVPSICLLDLIRTYDYKFSENDLHVLFDHVLRIHDTVPRFISAQTVQPEAVILLHTVPLAAAARQPAVFSHSPELRKKLCETLSKLDSYLREHKGQVRRASTLEPCMLQDGVPIEIVPASVVLGKSLAVLVELSLPLEDDGSGEVTAASFMDNAIDVLGGVSEEAVESLRILRRDDTSPQPVHTTASIGSLR